MYKQFERGKILHPHLLHQDHPLHLMVVKVLHLANGTVVHVLIEISCDVESRNDSKILSEMHMLHPTGE